MVCCFGLCGGSNEEEVVEQGDNWAVLDTKRVWQPTDGAMTVTRTRAAGVGQVFAEQTVLQVPHPTPVRARKCRPPYHTTLHPPFLASPQDRAYWEVTVEKLAARCGLAVGVVGHTHAKGEPLGGSAASWALTASDMPTLQEGDVLGVWLDQGDYPVTLRYAHNGVQIPATACLSPSAEALPAVQLGGEEVRSLTATDSRPPEQPYPARPAAPPHLPLPARAQTDAVCRARSSRSTLARCRSSTSPSRASMAS